MFMKAMKIGKKKKKCRRNVLFLRAYFISGKITSRWKTRTSIGQKVYFYFGSSSTENRTAPLWTNKFKYLLREKDEVEEEADRSGSHSSLGS